jgi:ribosomal protein S20
MKMPQHKSAEKRVKTNDRDRNRNVAPATISEIDSALKKGIIPRGRADRLKSRLAKRRNNLAAGAAREASK